MVVICGIEEAGRGPVIGPLVMVGLSIKQEDEEKLVNLGVKDSKLLTPLQREKLYKKILDIVKKVRVIVVHPKEIDDAVLSQSSNLNLLEGDKIIEIINDLEPDLAFIDCPSNNIKKFQAYIEKGLTLKTGLRLEHKADTKFPIVSAASIIAKVTRDKEIEEIKHKILQDFGSGYPADPLTAAFIKENFEKFPDIFRKSWSSYQKLVKAKDQSKIGDF